jgi:hypothetical protein
LCALGLVVGLIFGGVTAAGSEKAGGKVYTEREIKKIVPFEIMAEIPVLQISVEEAAARKSAMLAGAIAAAILFVIAAGSAITYLRG